MTYKFNSLLWRYPGYASWYFITLPKDASQEIKLITSDQKKGFGSVKVEAKIGNTKFSTSIFPDNKSGCYFLPIKKAVRNAENLGDGSEALVKLKLIIAGS